MKLIKKLVLVVLLTSMGLGFTVSEWSQPASAATTLKQGQARTRLGVGLSYMASGLRKGTELSRGEEFEELRPLLFAISNIIMV